MFFHLEELWSPHFVDRFACSYNAKLPRFNSRFLQPGAEAVDAFSQDWFLDNNWLAPPTTLIGRVLCHMRDCKALGTLIVPMWKSAQLWPLLCSDGVHLNSFVKDSAACFFRTDRISLLRVGHRIPCLVPRHLSLDVLQFGFDFATVGFCTSPKGWCPVCRS